LLDTGAALDVTDKDLNTLLHLAARNGYKEVIDQLLKQGAALDAKNEYSYTVLHLASRNGHN
jgi:ankyrin repeat protein